MVYQEYFDIQAHIHQFERDGGVTRTFRRLDPDRQEAVVQAILEEAGTKGPNSLNIKEVANKAGISVGSLYQYFGNREGLLNFAIALCVRYMTVMAERVGQALENLPVGEA